MAGTVVPAVRELDEDGWDAACGIVESALSDRTSRDRRQLRLFLVLIQWTPVLRWLRPFTALAPDRRRRFLSALEDAPALILRRGVWGVRTLAFMAYYGLPEVRRDLGYRAHPRGWRAERVRSGMAESEALEPGPEVQL